MRELCIAIVNIRDRYLLCKIEEDKKFRGKIFHVDI